MKLLLDFFPILLFFGAYKMADIYTATAVLMGATVLQTAIIYKMDGKLQTMHKITLVLVLGFGALTLSLHDERFIKWKPTLLYSGLAIALAVAHWLLKKNFLHMLLGTQLQLPHAVWNRLNLSWMLYCVFMATINAYVAHYFSTEDWVNFKLWGYVFPLVFILGQGLYISRYLPKDEGDQKMSTGTLPLSAQIHARLTERLQPTALRVIDESAQHAGHVGANDSGEGTHMRVCIASPLFTGIGRVQRHRLVYDALQDFIDQGLHALAIELI